MSLDPQLLQKRRKVMTTVNLVCALVAAAAAYGYFSLDVSWALAFVVAAVATGFAAQLWFILGLRKGA